MSAGLQGSPIPFRTSSAAGPGVSRAQSAVDSDAGEEPCSEWFGRKVKSCLLCCFSPCMSLCSCTSKVAPEPEPPSETETLDRFLQQLPTPQQVRANSAHMRIQQIIQTALREHPSLLCIESLGLTKRGDIRQAVRALRLGGIKFDSFRGHGDQIISRCVKVANLCQAFPNLATLDLSNAGIGQVETFRNLQGGLEPTVDCADTCLKNIATNCTKLVFLTLSQNDITDAALQNLRSLNKLSVLILNGCKVTEKGIAELKKELPDLTVLQIGPPSRHPSLYLASSPTVVAADASLGAL